MKLHSETHVRLVRAKTVHGLLPGDTLDRKLNIHIQNLFKQICKISFIYINDIVYIHKGQLHIDLGKLRLTVRTEIFITEAARDLDITVISGTHKKLLVKLRRLRQSVKAARMNSGRNQVISGAFRCTLSKDRSLHLQETFFCKEFSGESGNLAFHHKISLDIRSSQIQITVF